MPGAVRDLEDIYDYVAEHDPSAAERLRRNLVQAVKNTHFVPAGRTHRA
jgi:plasmid stabilization system protein ParE